MQHSIGPPSKGISSNFKISYWELVLTPIWINVGNRINQNFSNAMGGVEGWWMLTTLATFGVLTGSLRKRAHGKHSFSVNFEPRDLIFLPNWRWEQGLSFQPALFFEICSFWGSIFSPSMPRTCQKRVSFLGGRCGIDEVLPDPIFLPQWDRMGLESLQLPRKGFPLLFWLGWV